MKKLIYLLIVAVLLSSCRAEITPPNIIIFLTDDQHPSTIGAYGNTQVETPNIDRLAKEGLMFMNNYATTSICMASRASIMTGLYEYRTGCNFKHGPLHYTLFQQSYPVLLRQHDYYTGFAGKFGFAVVEGSVKSENYGSNDRMPVDEFDWWAGGPGQTSYITANNKSIDKYAAEYPHSTRAYGAACSDFIEKAAALDKPFCLSMSFKAPHRPNTPDPFFNEVYAETDWIKPSNYGRENAKHLPVQSKLGRQYLNLYKGFGYLNNYRETMRNYMQLIHGVDYAIGMIMEELEKQGVADNTVIIFTADNGYNMGAHGFGGKVLPYEEGSRTPLIIYDPRIVQKYRGRRTDAVTGNIDIAPTILELAGIPVPETMDGLSLVNLMEEPQEKVREALPLIQAWGTAPNMAFSMVSEEYKYLYWYYEEGLEPGEEFYSLKEDPLEMVNLIHQENHQEALVRMREIYDEELARWNEQSVDYAGYQEFSILFDRSLPWDVKRSQVPEQFMEVYRDELDKLGYNGDINDYEQILDHVEKK